MSPQLIWASSILIVIAVAVPLLFHLSRYLGDTNRGNASKNSVYESGVTHPIGQAEHRYNIQFYLVAILFVIFDVEIMFMFPWAVNVKELSYFGLFEMFLFMTLLLAGLYYVYKKGALKWQ